MTKAQIAACVDGKQVLDVAIPPGATVTTERPDPGIKELHIGTWKTSAAYRDVRVRRLGAE